MLVAFFQRKIIALIRFYQRILAFHLRGHCRFQPTCSCYAILAIEKKGILIGGLKTFWRIFRCSPLTKQGTADLP
ncbi:membrane protein insertion efficiency factor YidD [Candidatus Gribaldobacteria bacterium]|nr:membrane protein insertion efficiency factor YidD [Candidatus Gribaldobacteria bacterium]